MNTERTTTYHVDERVVRLIAFQVILFTLFALFRQQLWPLLFLTIDFALRAFSHWPSPLAILAKGLLRLSNRSPKPIFAAPKKFAAGVGFTFVLITGVFLYFQLFTGAYILGGLLVLCAFLESIFNICVGCYIYNWFVAPFYNRN